MRASPRRWRCAALAGLFGLAAFVYSPYWAAEYAFVDDYPALAGLSSGAWLSVEVDHRARDGRMVPALALPPAIHWAGDIAGLRRLRFFSALGLCALATLLSAAVLRRGAPIEVATVAGAGALLLPSAIVFASWAITLFMPWAAALGLLAGELFAASLREASSINSTTKGRWTLRLVALAALSLSLATYQPSALLFWLSPALTWLFGPPTSGRRKWRTLVSAGAFFGATLAVYLITWKAWVRILYPGSPGSDRARLVAPADVPSKLVWFVREPLRNAFSLFVLPARGWIVAVVALLVVAGLALRARSRGESPLGATLALAALLPATYAANLAVAESWAAYRTLLAPSLLVWLALLAATLGLATSLLGQRSGRRAWTTVAVVGLLFQAGLSRWDLARQVVEPQVEELAIVRRGVARMLAAGCSSVVFRMPRWSDNQRDLHIADEIGSPSSAAPWVPLPMLEVLVSERTGANLVAQVDVKPPDAALAGGRADDPCRIDMPRELRRRARRDERDVRSGRE